MEMGFILILSSVQILVGQTGILENLVFVIFVQIYWRRKMTQPFEEESIDSRNTMRETLAYDMTSSLAIISAEDIEKASKEREKLQKLHGRDAVDLWESVV